MGEWRAFRGRGRRSEGRSLARSSLKVGFAASIIYIPKFKKIQIVSINNLSKKIYLGIGLVAWCCGERSGVGGEGPGGEIFWLARGTLKVASQIVYIYI